MKPVKLNLYVTATARNGATGPLRQTARHLLD